MWESYNPGMANAKYKFVIHGRIFTGYWYIVIDGLAQSS